jgi:hypothetical protein
MASEELGEMSECDFADTCAEKFLLMSMGAKRGHVKRAQTESEDFADANAELGPPLA